MKTASISESTNNEIINGIKAINLALNIRDWAEKEDNVLSDYLNDFIKDKKEQLKDIFKVIYPNSSCNNVGIRDIGGYWDL